MPPVEVHRPPSSGGAWVFLAVVTVAHVSGIVHWQPPPVAMEYAAAALQEGKVSAYGPCEGMPELIAALVEKLRLENGLDGVQMPCYKVLLQPFASSCDSVICRFILSILCI